MSTEADAELYARSTTPSTYSINTRPGTGVRHSRDLANSSLNATSTIDPPPTAATFTHKSDEGVKAYHFQRNLRTGRSLGAPAARPPWPRQAPQHESMTQAEVEHNAHRHWSCLEEKHEQHRRATVRIVHDARAKAERARLDLIDSPLRHLPELERGRAFLDEVEERTLRPHDARQRDRVAALHALWEKHVYIPVRDQLQHKRAGESFSMLEEAAGSAVHRAERGRKVLNAAESRASIEQVDPSHAHAFKMEREKSVLSSTSHALLLAKRHGAIVHADGSYELPAPRTISLSQPLPHALLGGGGAKAGAAVEASDGTIRCGLATYHPTEAAFRRRVAEVRAAELAMGSAMAPTVGSADPYAAPDTGIWGASGPGTQSCKAMLVGGRHARQMLQPQAWGEVQIRDTTWAHEWPVAGEGLVPRSDPAVRAVAAQGEAQVDSGRKRLWPHGAPPLSNPELSAQLLEEFAPIVGRGKLSVSGPAQDGKTSWEAARGRGRHAELADRFARDQVKPLIELAPAAEADEGGSRRAKTAPRPQHPLRADHVRALIQAEPPPEQPASPTRYAGHRAVEDHVGPLLN